MSQTELPLEKQKCGAVAHKKLRAVTSDKVVPEPIDVLAIVSMTTNINSELIKGDSRLDSIVQPRFLAAYFMYEWCGFTNKQVATYLGYDDHSSIVHARQTVVDMLSINDRYFKTHADKIERVLKNLYKKYERPQKKVYVSPFSKN